MNETELHNLRVFLEALAKGRFDPDLTPLMAAFALEMVDRAIANQPTTTLRRVQ